MQVGCMTISCYFLKGQTSSDYSLVTVLPFYAGALFYFNMGDNGELLGQFPIDFHKQLLTENNGTGNIFFHHSASLSHCPRHWPEHGRRLHSSSRLRYRLRLIQHTSSFKIPWIDSYCHSVTL